VTSLTPRAAPAAAFCCAGLTAGGLDDCGCAGGLAAEPDICCTADGCFAS